jgi:hypothetical protein
MLAVLKLVALASASVFSDFIDPEDRDSFLLGSTLGASECIGPVECWYCIIILPNNFYLTDWTRERRWPIGSASGLLQYKSGLYELQRLVNNLPPIIAVL